MCFALYQFSKHRGSSGGRSTGAYQIEKTKKILTNSLDLWKYEIVDGKNNREELVLVILSRDTKVAAKHGERLLAVKPNKKVYKSTILNSINV